MLKNIIKTIGLLVAYTLLCYIIFYSTKTKSNIIKTNNIVKNPSIIALNNYVFKTNKSNDLPIGKIIINKISLNKPLYSKESPNNNIESNIAILKESNDPSLSNTIFFLAAHSGSGKKAFFKNLNKLEKNDEIILEYKNCTYLYIVKDIWENKKTGKINISKENTNQLVLTTCSPNNNDYQLIINCIKK